MATTRNAVAAKNRRAEAARPARRPKAGSAGKSSRARGGRTAAASMPVELEMELDAEQFAPTGTRRVVQKLRGAGSGLKSAGATVGGAVAQHPVPIAMIGAGVAWLLLEGRARGLAQKAVRAIGDAELLERAGEALGEVSSRVGDAAGTVREAFLAGVGSVGETISGAADSVRERAARLGEYTQEGAQTVAEGARRGYTASKEGLSSAWQQHPLTTGLAVLAAGVAVGMMLPGTQRERDMMGEQSDALSRRGRKVGEQLVNRSKRVAASVAGVVKQTAEREGFGVGEVVRKVGRIARRGQEAATDAAKRARLDPVSVLRESK